VNDLYTEFNLLPLHHLHTQQLLVLVFKFLFYNQSVPSVFRSYFVHNHDIHNYATRTISDLHIFVLNSSFGKRRIKYKCIVLWNSLLDHLKVSSTLKLFKKSIKNHLNSLCISDLIIDKLELKSDFEIVLNGHDIYRYNKSVTQQI